MNIHQIRQLVDPENRPDAARIVHVCREALDNRPATVGEHAEILYYLAEASYALEPWLAAKYAEKARVAAKKAIEAEDFLLAAKAVCLHISLLNVALPHSFKSRVSDMKEWQGVLVDVWRPQMSGDDYVAALNAFNLLSWGFTRQAQNARYAAR